ncbi:hypothetical protein GCM10012286_06160 [Streptomyces lasiicapitis]|uniref:Uncharacterized protein n=1 Tax=Streptomyces lasiicapitis TaxID=1923961 RepID=A0ABQ2LID4_9ACTN|nr:hypothetical protein GCM10012286_06160 [Streptomyces lasiicapitis]
MGPDGRYGTQRLPQQPLTCGVRQVFGALDHMGHALGDVVDSVGEHGQERAVRGHDGEVVGGLRRPRSGTMKRGVPPDGGAISASGSFPCTTG